MSRLIVGLAQFEDTDNSQPKALDLHLPDGQVITVAVSEIRTHRALIAITAPDSIRIERKYNS